MVLSETMNPDSFESSIRMTITPGPFMMSFQTAGNPTCDKMFPILHHDTDREEKQQPCLMEIFLENIMSRGVMAHMYLRVVCKRFQFEAIGDTGKYFLKKPF